MKVLLVSVGLVVAFVGGCKRGAVGEHCYEVEQILVIPDSYHSGLHPMKGPHGELSGLIDCRDYSGDCSCRALRVDGPELEEVLCLYEHEQAIAWRGQGHDLGDGLFVVISGFPEWPVPMGMCWDLPLSYELWDIVNGMQASFSSFYALQYIISDSRFLGVASPCDQDDPEPGFEFLHLVDGSGQLLTEHTRPGGVTLEGVDPSTRDYYLQHVDDTFSGYDIDGQEFPLVIGGTVGCRFAGALGGVHSFICPEGSGSYSLAVGRPGGPVGSQVLASAAKGAVGGKGSVVAIVLESGQLQVYRFEQGHLEPIWTNDVSSDLRFPRVSQGTMPLVTASTGEHTYIFDAQGRPVENVSGSAYHVGDVGEYVTILGDNQIETYRVLPAGECSTP